MSADGYVGVGGSLDLDPRVHFVAETERAAYYRAGVYDRYTGDGWVRTTDVGAATDPSRPASACASESPPSARWTCCRRSPSRSPSRASTRTSRTAAC
ncbi:hypothetical protein [Halobacterium sp. CBA1126]|uniref:hypothetical protein n=1 Tax=Halobacterium sp. CBA1126 TaxID=2668074 RepID=UPI0012FC7A68|nr:hypothetical protein [Halobacterium sp. CBA1126]MUV59761.1 hypothetical protein [Halobacterium sp. CBA1126]